MFTKKTPKRETVGGTSLTFHTLTDYPKEHWYNGYINVVSIDPGIVNFGFRIETRHSNSKVETVVLTRQCFSKAIVNEGYYNSLYLDVISWLSLYESYFNNCHVFIIERQIPENYQSVRLSQHIVSYLLCSLLKSPIKPIIAEIDPGSKYKQLGAPAGYNKIALKKWGIEYAYELLKQRNDQMALDIVLGTKGIRGQKKQDDLCDTIIQVEAFWSLFNIPIVKLN